MEDRQDPSEGPDRGRDLDQRLNAARRRARPAKPEKSTGELGAAMRIAVDLVAGIAVGVFVGWLLDRWLGTGPWLLILFFVLGSAAGIRNVFKTAEALNRQAGQSGRRQASGKDDES